jgi:addiction module HigA family antidote
MNKYQNKFIAEDEIHPGEILKDELTARGLRAVDLVDLTNLSKAFISQIINGTRSINATTAVKLELALGISAKTWLTMQCDYDISIARKALKHLRTKKRNVKV